MLYCDHYYEDGKRPACSSIEASNRKQPEMLRTAGYASIVLLHEEGGMALYSCAVY